MPTRILIRRPSASDTRSTRSRRSASSASSGEIPAAPSTPVGARYSPNTSRSVPAHSPVVAPARAAASVAGMMFTDSSRAALASSSSALSTAAWSRSERHFFTASICPRSTSGSTVRMPPSSPSWSGERSVFVNTFWPTTFSSPSSIFLTRARCDSTSCVFM